MNYKVEGAIKKSRVAIIIAIILWFVMAIAFIIPFTCANYTTVLLGRFDSQIYIEIFGKIATDPAMGFITLAKHKLIFNYIKNLFGFSLIYFVIVVIGFIRKMPKHRYDDIEHGSSDWSEHGAQYQILNKKEGIILAENNYLPLNKRGNVNVLVVGGSGSGKTRFFIKPNIFCVKIIINIFHFIYFIQINIIICLIFFEYIIRTKTIIIFFAFFAFFIFFFR